MRVKNPLIMNTLKWNFLLFELSDVVIEKIVQNANKTAGDKMTKKLIFPLFYIAEWVFFLYVLLFILIFNLFNYVNFLLVDMLWEERVPLTSSTTKSLLIILVIGLVCFIYIRYLAGHRVYRKFKAAIWGIVFSINSLSCISLFIISMNFGFDLYEGERMILLVAACISMVLTVQVIMKYESERGVIS